MRKLVVITIGNEVLSGRTIDTHAAWLARQLLERSLTIAFRLTVADESEEIKAALDYARDREASLVITIGGLGPTFDDITLQAIAQWAGLQLVEYPEIVDEIKEKYKKFFDAGMVDFPELNAPRRKMALLPSGSRPLPNDVGVSPGVELKFPWGHLIALPGVPAEMKSIVRDSLLESLPQEANSVIRTREVKTAFRDESILAGLIERVMAALPGLYAKSHPQKFDHDTFLTVFLTVHAETEEDAEKILSKAEEIIYLGN